MKIFPISSLAKILIYHRTKGDLIVIALRKFAANLNTYIEVRTYLL